MSNYILRFWQKCASIMRAFLPRKTEEWNPGPAPDFVARLVPRVMAEFVARVPEEYSEGLGKQVAAIQTTSIDWTVVGFYANFTLDRANIAPMSDLAKSAPIIIDGIIEGAPPENCPSYLLWFEDGVISCLEGVVAGERFPEIKPNEGTYFFETETFESHRKSWMERHADSTTPAK